MGQTYLIYAHRLRDGQLATSICARTRPVAEAAEDLTYLRSLATLVPGTPGRVASRPRHCQRVVVDEAGRPVRDASIRLQRSGRGDSIGWTFVTGEDGRFVFTIPEGQGYGVYATSYVGDSSNREVHVGMLPSRQPSELRR